VESKGDGASTRACESNLGSNAMRVRVAIGDPASTSADLHVARSSAASRADTATHANVNAAARREIASATRAGGNGATNTDPLGNALNLRRGRR
jgi:hypothetical protein